MRPSTAREESERKGRMIAAAALLLDGNASPLLPVAITDHIAALLTAIAGDDGLLDSGHGAKAEALATSILWSVRDPQSPWYPGTPEPLPATPRRRLTFRNH